MSETPGTMATPVSGPRRGTFLGYRWALLAFLLAGVAQISLAGLGVFSLHDQGEAAFAPHRDLGFAMAGIALLVLVLALIARPGARAIAGSAVLVLLTSLMQSLLAGLGEGPRGLRRPARPRRAAHPGHRGLPVRPGLAARSLGAVSWQLSRWHRPPTPPWGGATATATGRPAPDPAARR